MIPTQELKRQARNPYFVFYSDVNNRDEAPDDRGRESELPERALESHARVADQHPLQRRPTQVFHIFIFSYFFLNYIWLAKLQTKTKLRSC